MEAEPRDPIQERLSVALDFVTREILSSDKTSAKAKFFIRKMMQEALSELESAPPEMVQASFLSSTAMMYWVSTGELIQNLPMPEGFWDFSAEQISPTASPLSLESGRTTDDAV